MINLKFKNQNAKLWISLILIFEFCIFHSRLLQAEVANKNIPDKIVGYSQVGSWTRDEWDYERFLDILSEFKMNYTRVFGIVPWYGGLMPWPKEADGRYDLTRFDEGYWSRLSDYVRYANNKGIIVHFTLFDRCGMTDDDGWLRHPFNPQNNINNISARRGWHTFTEEFFREIQKNYIIRAVRELKNFNILFEVANEPNDGIDWHKWVIEIIRESSVGNQQPPVPEGSNRGVVVSINIEPFNGDYDWVSFHIKKLPSSIQGGNFIYSDDGVELTDPDTLYKWAKEVFDKGGSYEHLSAAEDIKGNMPPEERLRALYKARYGKE
jgi:hypothetical protein